MIAEEVQRWYTLAVSLTLSVACIAYLGMPGFASPAAPPTPLESASAHSGARRPRRKRARAEA
eukprot:6209021-Pleurochrysis_carterae.AAC.1